MCVCNHRYPACNAHASYCHLRPVWLYHIFSYILINGTICGKYINERKMCTLIFATIFLWNISKSKKYSATYCHKCTHVFMQSTRYSCHILTNVEFSQRGFEKHTNIIFHENPSSGSRVLPCGRSDWQTDMTKIMVAFRNFAKVPRRAYKVSKSLNSHTLEGTGRGYIQNVTTTGETDGWEEAGVLRQTNCRNKDS